MQITTQLPDFAPRLGTYLIDPGHSTISFRTRHLFGLAAVHGRFAILTGTVDIAEPLAASRVVAEIDAASFRTRSSQRDASVRSARLLDTAHYPVLTFVAGRPDGQVLSGTLTVRDVRRPVCLSIEQFAVSTDSFTMQARARIDRTDFGLTAYRGLAARHLDLSVEVRCVRK